MAVRHGRRQPQVQIVLVGAIGSLVKAGLRELPGPVHAERIAVRSEFRGLGLARHLDGVPRVRVGGVGVRGDGVQVDYLRRGPVEGRHEDLVLVLRLALPVVHDVTLVHAEVEDLRR